MYVNDGVLDDRDKVGLESGLPKRSLIIQSLYELEYFANITDAIVILDFQIGA